MKTAEEILNKYQRKTEPAFGEGFYYISPDDAEKAMEEYASQFHPTEAREPDRERPDDELDKIIKNRIGKLSTDNYWSTRTIAKEYAEYYYNSIYINKTPPPSGAEGKDGFIEWIEGRIKYWQENPLTLDDNYVRGRLYEAELTLKEYRKFSIPPTDKKKEIEKFKNIMRFWGFDIINRAWVVNDIDEWIEKNKEMF